MQTKMSPQEYLQARWDKLSNESKRTLHLDQFEARDFLITSWLKQYYERKAMMA
jgi:hypothetical protein